MTAQGQEMEQARELAALGGLYFQTGDLPRALEALRAAIAVQERIKDGLGQASALRVAGNAASAMGQHGVALEIPAQVGADRRRPERRAHARADCERVARAG